MSLMHSQLPDPYNGGNVKAFTYLDDSNWIEGINYLKDGEELGHNLVGVPMMSGAFDGVVANHNLPLCPWLS